MKLSEESDEAAIRRVIEEMHAAIWAKDFDAFANLNVHADYARRWVWWLPNTLVVKEGWEAIGARIAQVMADPLMPDGIDPAVMHKNFNLRISGDMAWVTFDRAAPVTQTVNLGIAGHSHEMRVLEKHSGQWKVAFFAAINRSTPFPDFPRFRLDHDGRVLWKNDEAERELAEGTGLKVMGGRLVARVAATNRALQSAIGWAATLNLGFTVERGAVPVLPEPAEGELAKIWWVTADADVIQVAVHDRRLPDSKLALAAAVYGLSPAQERMAKAIVSGQDLPQIAKTTGITLNTARTHLRRLFDKTGVRNQQALVRALLTVSVPD